MKKQNKDEITTVRFTTLQKVRIMLLARERQWSISKMVQFMIDSYCNNIFEENSIKFKER